MAQFVAFEKGIEVNGQTILSIINTLADGKEILNAHGIKNPEAGKWYPQQAWLDTFKAISKEIGEQTLFSIGTAVPENALFPSDVDNLEKGLKSIDLAYRMNHRGGEIGTYRLIRFNEKARKAVMICQNPYPSEFDRGIISSMLRKFKPASSSNYEVNLDTTKGSRINGEHSCTYNISW